MSFPAASNGLNVSKDIWVHYLFWHYKIYL